MRFYSASDTIRTGSMLRQITGHIRSAGIRILLGIACLLAMTGYSLAKKPFEVVHFPSGALPGSAQGKEKTPIWGHLAKPDGEGPHPAVVLLHGCGGIQQSYFDWAQLLARAGFMALVVDSFHPRSLTSDCSGLSSSASPTARTLDAFGALRFLNGLEFVDPDRIGLIGWSQGGITVQYAANAHGLGSRFENSFKAAVALYPYCIADRTYAVPLLVLIGEADDWTPVSECRKLEHRNRERQNDVELVVYPGAFHAFDNPAIGAGFYFPGASGQRHWLQYNADAHTDATERIVTFLKDRL
ncbi:dienelactone hydrolase family protein [Roseibium sp. SCPC15]|uniref:dienelactone hydrolase family protein n=1 Tax=Roseibium sp. SCP15 TaxID=3141376 RepID=UPI003334E546